MIGPPARRRRGRWALLLVVAGCAGAEPAPAGPPGEAELRAAAAADTLDPWPHYALARLHEERGEIDAALEAYGRAINLLPPRQVTGPVFDLGRLHLRLGNAAAARRCFEEVLETFPADTRGYRLNPDYRGAALGLKAALESAGETGPLGPLRARFLDELGGTPAEWERGPPWLAPSTGPPAPADPVR